MSTLLLIDDDDEVLSINCKYLSGEGYSVYTASNLQRIIPAFSVRQEVSLVEGMKEIMPVYCVIGKIPAVRNISNKIIVLEKRGRY